VRELGECSYIDMPLAAIATGHAHVGLRAAWSWRKRARLPHQHFSSRTSASRSSKSELGDKRGMIAQFTHIESFHTAQSSISLDVATSQKT
jgi:hypothetical protein